MTLGLRSRLRQAVLRLAQLPMPLRVPQPVRLRILSHLLVLLHNPPRLAGFLLALLLRVLVVTRWSLSRRPVSLRVSLPSVTLLPPGWLTSFMRSALTRALFLMRKLRVAGLRLGSASLRLRPHGSASECTLALRRYRRRWLPGRRLWLAAPSPCRASYLRVRAPTPWLTTPFLPRLSL